VLVGATAGTALVVRQPVFWSGLVIAMFKAAVPILTKRMTPEQEAEWRAAERAGRGDEWLRKRRKAPPKG
jgi:hypothetical protein